MRTTISARRPSLLVALLALWILSGCGGTALETAWIQAAGGHAGPVRALAWDPQGRWLASGSLDNTIKLWDPATGQERRTLSGHADSALALALPVADAAPAFRERVRALAARLDEAGLKRPILLFLNEIERVLPQPADPVEKVREFNALFGVLRALNQEERLVALLIADLHADANRINYWSQPGVATNPVFSYSSRCISPRSSRPRPAPCSTASAN